MDTFLAKERKLQEDDGASSTVYITAQEIKMCHYNEDYSTFILC